VCTLVIGNSEYIQIGECDFGISESKVRLPISSYALFSCSSFQMARIQNLAQVLVVADHFLRKLYICLFEEVLQEDTKSPNQIKNEKGPLESEIAKQRKQKGQTNILDPRCRY
jgi:hypothetical protein